MEIQDFKLLGLPILEAQLKLHKINFTKALNVLNNYKDVKISLIYESTTGEWKPVQFSFLDASLPVEFVIAFEHYNNRLISEIWQIEAAIEELRTEKQQSDLLSLFNK